jgi:GTPase
MDELDQLARTAGAEVVARVSQRLSAPTKAFYVGTGKLDELAALKERLEYDLIIADDELSPVQQHNLEDKLKVKVVDRVALILDIFAARASTREGRLQVELAQQVYLLPRLVGQWRHLERLGAGIGTRGPGESQLETDRRLARDRIRRLEAQIEDIRKHRDLYRQRRKRSAIPVVAVVGYTNAGKSTLFNALTRASVLVEDKVFATLDPTTRRVPLPGGGTVLLTDTVGFIRKLPPAIVAAFRATLEELSEAAVLVHVVDISSPYSSQQSKVVEDTLADLGLSDRPRITVLNKIDRLLPADAAMTEADAISYVADANQGEQPAENTVLVSATRGWGLAHLVHLVQDFAGTLPSPEAHDVEKGPS